MKVLDVFQGPRITTGEIHSKIFMTGGVFRMISIPNNQKSGFTIRGRFPIIEPMKYLHGRETNVCKKTHRLLTVFCGLYRRAGGRETGLHRCDGDWLFFLFGYNFYASYTFWPPD